MLDEPTLRQRIVERILALRQRGPRGIDQLPPVVAVRVTVAWQRSVGVVRGYVDDPAFDDEVGAALANRLVGVGAAVPMRLYEVRSSEAPDVTADAGQGRPDPGHPQHAGSGVDTVKQPHIIPGANTVTVREATGGAWARLRIEGGDRDGDLLSIAGNRPRYHVGRGEWHGDSEAPANDLVVSRDDRFISRRSAVLRRAGSGLEIASLDQGEFLIVVRADGRRIRPTHARSGRVRIATGDRIELTDGERQRVILHVERPAIGSEDEPPTPSSDMDSGSTGNGGSIGDTGSTDIRATGSSGQQSGRS